MADTIFIKGTREGLTVTLMGDGAGAVDVGRVLEDLERHLDTRGAFFRGGLVALELGQRSIAQDGIERIQRLLGAHDMTLRTVVAADETSERATQALGLRLVRAEPTLDGAPTQPTLAGDPGGRAFGGGEAHPAPVSDTTTQPPIGRVPEAALDTGRGQENPRGRAAESGRGVFVHHTVRSGQIFRHTGDIVVIGDVNAGGQVIAGGDIVVWGRLLGTAYAGAMGDATAAVCALDMSPMQLRIAHVVARPEDDTQGTPGRAHPDASVAEVAYVRGDAIVLSPWHKVPRARGAQESS